MLDPVVLLPPLPRDFSREDALRRLERLYAQLPTIACQRLCHHTCTSIVASELERQRIAEAGASIGQPVDGKRFHQEVFGNQASPPCPALGPRNDCTIYELRPFICRAYGVGENLRCAHGCVPDRVLPDSAVHLLIAKIEQISRHVTGVASWPPKDAGLPAETDIRDRIGALQDELDVQALRARLPAHLLTEGRQRPGRPRTTRNPKTRKR